MMDICQFQSVRSYLADGTPLCYSPSDNCFYVYEYDKGHAHPATWSVFPFFGTISKHNLSRLMRTKEWYDAGCSGE